MYIENCTGSEIYVIFFNLNILYDAIAMYQENKSFHVTVQWMRCEC
jgi:hypothetical protein